MRTLMPLLFASFLWVSGALAAESGDHQARAAEHASYDRFIGTWDVGYEIYDKDGGVRRYHGQVAYSWILGGGALQEIWTSDSHNTVLTGRNESGALERWATSDIQPDSFVARFETSADEGKTWRLLGVNHMQRHRA